MEEIKINGAVINNIRYTDDTAILAENSEDLRLLMNKVSEISEEMGFGINDGKTECMVIADS